MPLFKKPIEQQFFNLRLREGRSMTELEFYARELTAWETSPERREMIDGDRYYNGDHDILKRQRTAIGDEGKLIVVDNLPNNRIVDNFNRDILINESEIVDNCGKSAGIISNETIIAMHPWVDDQAAELERLEKEKEAADPYRAAFEQAQALRSTEGGEPINEE